MTVYSLEDPILYKKFKNVFLLGISSIFQAVEKDGAVVRALRARRQVILDNIRDNDELSNNYLKVAKYN